jgi:beta-N-acetylhexosaminidase
MSAGGLEPAAAACLFPGFDGLTAPDWLRRGGFGGVVLFARNIRDRKQLAELTASLPGFLIAVDEEGGDVTRLEAGRGSSFPGNLALGAVDDVALTSRVAAAIGGELAACGVNLDLAPVADVIVDPANAIVGVRSFGSDPALVSRHVAAFVEGLQSVGVAGCAKHFPGHGESVADSHLELPSVETGLETLRARALPAFAAAVEAGVRAVMTAHVRFSALDDEPASLSENVVLLLRSELGFDGLVITDALEMRAISATAGLEAGAVRALAAGADALCLGADLAAEQVAGVHAAIVRAMREGRLAEARLWEAAGRVAEAASWASSPRPHRDREAGVEAARRALRVEGDVTLSGEPLVIELRPEASIAAGEARHGMGGVQVHEGEQLPRLDDFGRVVVVVRDAPRHAWQRELVPPGTIVVETGLPAWRPPQARAWVATYGAGRANLEAAAELLRGRAAAR